MSFINEARKHMTERSTKVSWFKEDLEELLKKYQAKIIDSDDEVMRVQFKNGDEGVIKLKK